MDGDVACTLLLERGYGLLCRFDHVHATAAGQEWHVCRVDEMATINPSQFLACLEEAMRFSWQPEEVHWLISGKSKRDHLRTLPVEESVWR